MSKLDKRFYEDRALRDAAREVFVADVTHAKATFSGKGLAERTVGRIGEGALDVLETAKDRSQDNRGIIAALIGAIVLWFARAPVLDILGLSEGDEPDEDTLPIEDNHADEAPLNDPETLNESVPPPIPSGEHHE